MDCVGGVAGAFGPGGVIDTLASLFERAIASIFMALGRVFDR